MINNKIHIDEIIDDIDTIFWSMKLSHIRRFFHQRFWEKETRDSEYASRIEPFPRLETVAEHSWLVADVSMILGPHFEELDLSRCIELSIIHDKLENITGDKNPVGRDGTGSKTHAFSEEYRTIKNDLETEALEKYLNKLRPSIRNKQKEIILEMIEGKTKESLFVKAVDKLLALAFVYVKKKGDMSDMHLRFTIKYSKKVYDYFPPLRGHHDELINRLFKQVAAYRSISVDELEYKLFGPKYRLF